VIVRGGSTTRKRGETKLVVQEIEPFEPTPEEIAAARRRRSTCARGARAGRPPPSLS
jgi:hypothetical protein